MENANNFLTSVSEAIQTELTEDLQNMASTQGWPDHIVDVLSVRVTKNKIDVHYPSALSDDIENIEYGHNEQPPSSVIRHFKRKLEQKSMDILHKEIDNNPLGALLSL